MKNLLKNRKGLSPVIATVILVSVTIVVAIAVSYWMGAIAGLYTRFEKVEITSCYATKEPGKYTVTVQLKNSGSQDSSINYVLVNGKPSDQYNVITSEAVGTAAGPGTKMSLDFAPVVADSEKIYAGTATPLTRGTDYTIDNALGEITWVTGQTGKIITADYTPENPVITVSWTTLDPSDNGILPTKSMTVRLGKSGTITIVIDSRLYESGTTLDLKFHSAAGKDYPQMLSLP